MHLSFKGPKQTKHIYSCLQLLFLWHHLFVCGGTVQTKNNLLISLTVLPSGIMCPWLDVHFSFSQRQLL